MLTQRRGMTGKRLRLFTPSRGVFVLPLNMLTQPANRLTQPLLSLTVPCQFFVLPLPRLTQPYNRFTPPLRRLTQPLRRSNLPSRGFVSASRRLTPPANRLTPSMGNTVFHEKHPLGRRHLFRRSECPVGRPQFRSRTRRSGLCQPDADQPTPKKEQTHDS